MVQRLTLRLELDNGQFVGRIRASGRAVDDFTGRVEGGGRASERYNRAARRTEQANRRAATSFTLAQRAAVRFFGVLGGGFLVERLARETLEAADAYTELNNRIRLVADSEEAAALIRAELLDISQDTRTQLEANAELYSRISLAVRRFGRSEEESLRVTELLNQQVRIGGNNAIEASAGLIQFAQGLASGRLQGDELRSVLENLQGVSEGLIVGFRRLRQQGRIDIDVTRANIRELAAEGVLSADLLFDAILASADDTEEKFAGVQSTVADGAVTIRNAFVSAIGQLDQTLGLSQAIARQLERAAAAIDAGSRPTIISPDDVAFVEQMTGNLNQLDAAYQSFLRTVDTSQLDEQTIETQLAIARSALERFPDTLLQGEAGFGARQRAEATIERLTGLSRENIGATLRERREQLDAALSALQAREREFDLDPAGAARRDANILRSGPSLREQRAEVAELRAELQAAETVAARLLEVPINVRAVRRDLPEPSEEDVAAQYAERLAAQDEFQRSLTQSAYDMAAARLAIEGETFDLLSEQEREALARREEANRIADERIAAEAADRRARELEALRASREAEFLEAQGYRDREEAAEDVHQQALLAIRTRYAGGEFISLLQGQHRAQQQLEAGNQRAVAQILTGNLQQTLGALGRYNTTAFRLAQAAGIAKAVIDTQQAITEALKQPPPLNIVYAGLAAAQGAAAVATIRAQRPPQAFRLGGIVDSPTFFNARNLPRGGVAGEAGPEAILPVTRLAGGQYGVDARTAGSTTVNFSPVINQNIEVGEGVDADAIAERLGEQTRRDVGALFDGHIREALRPGGALNPTNTV